MQTLLRVYSDMQCVHDDGLTLIDLCKKWNSEEKCKLCVLFICQYVKWENMTDVFIKFYIVKYAFVLVLDFVNIQGDYFSWKYGISGNLAPVRELTIYHRNVSEKIFSGIAVWGWSVFIRLF